jgi:peroxiredoxin
MENPNGVGHPLPNAILPALRGETVDLASLRGKRRLLFMWGSW